MARPSKDFKPGPRLTPETPAAGPSFGKGRFTTTAPMTTESVVEETAVEVSVDDISVVLRPEGVPDEASFSKYDLRPMAGVGQVALEETETAEEETEDDVEPEAPDEGREPPPVVQPSVELGPWRSESRLDPNRYHRLDTRRV